MITERVEHTYQFKRGTAERLAEVNPILAEGEPAFETNTYKQKIGDGFTPYKALPYTGEGGSFPPTPIVPESVQADWEQNDSTQPDYIKNRTHYIEKQEPFTFDGNLDGHIVLDAYGGDFKLIKISDELFTIEDLIGQIVTFTYQGGNTVDHKIDENSFGDIPQETALWVIKDVMPILYIVNSSEDAAADIGGNPKDIPLGTYFVYAVDNYDYYISNLSLPETIVKIDEKFLPELATVAKTGNYNDLNNLPETLVVDQVYNATSENAQSGKAVAQAVYGKQDKLNSGVNIKTINGETILGEGDIVVSGDATDRIPKLPANGAPFYSVTVCDDSSNGEMPSDSAYTNIYIEDVSNAGIQGGFLVRRDTNKNIQTSTPLNDIDCANKKYVDEQIPDWNQNDSTQPDYIKNRTHYEEITTVNEPLNLTWDGNTEGLVCVDDMFYKVSDLILTDEQIKSGTLQVFTGNTVNIADIWEEMESKGYITTDVVAIESCAFVRIDGAIIAGITFPEKGIYFGSGGTDYVSALTTTEPVEHIKTVVHKLDKKYIPESNIKDSIGAHSLQQTQDSKYTGILLYNADEPEKSKNLNAVELDEALKSEQPIGATGEFATSFGGASSAQGKRSLAEGTNTIAKGKYSHAEGDNSVTLGNESHAEGYATTAYGTGSHAEGSGTVAYGLASHAGGTQSIAEGDASFAHGSGAIAIGIHSAAFGNQTITSKHNSMAIGSYNKDTGAMFVVGNGDDASRNNLFEVHDGTGDLAAGVYHNGDALVTMSKYGRKKISTKEILEIKDLDNPSNAIIDSTVTDNYFYKKNYIKKPEEYYMMNATTRNKPRITMSYYDDINKTNTNEIDIIDNQSSYQNNSNPYGTMGYIVFTTPNNVITYNRLNLYWDPDGPNEQTSVDIKSLKPNHQYMLMFDSGDFDNGQVYYCRVNYSYLVDYEDSYHWVKGQEDTSNIPCPYTIMIPHTGRIGKKDTLSIEYQCSEAAGLMYEKLIQITELLEEKSEGTLDFSNII